MKKSILITGVNGFIGSNIAKTLISSFRVFGIGRSNKAKNTLEDYKKIELPDVSFHKILKKWKPNFVIHCAGYGSVPFSTENPTADFDAGPRLVSHVLDAIRVSGIKADFVFPSSAAVYGNSQCLPITETAPLRPISPYGYHKLLSENIIRQYHELYGQNYLILRIFSCYGEGIRKQLLWDIAWKAQSESIELFGTGDETRDFIHVYDLAQAVKILITNEIKNIAINAASGKQISVRYLAQLLLQQLGKNIPLRFNGKIREGDPLYMEADISLLRTQGFLPKLSLEQGVGRFAQWYLMECAQR
ncbi:MAG: UDP-glucose 4-epimerase [Desulfomicrobiaceae bacterium]|jgi:UDP-glucose 4-epimerase|nr:UDP-glucose 4-epimerase [Desulfomicrobiaceae bacterium]